MVGVGNIVSVGGSGGGSGGGGGSGIQEINGQTGPIVTFVGINGIEVTVPSSNTVLLDGVALSGITSQSGVIGANGVLVEQIDGNFVVSAPGISGLIEPSGGIGGINGQIGPHIEVTGVNGIEVTVSSENELLIDGAGASGVGGGGGGTTIITSGTSTQYAESFSNTTSGQFVHGFGTRDVVVQIYDDSAPPAQLFPDRIIYDTLDMVSVLFNTPQTGRVVIIGSGVGCTLSGDVAVDSRRYALLVS